MATASFKRVAERFMSCSHRSAKESANEKPKRIVHLFRPFKKSECMSVGNAKCSFAQAKHSLDVAV
jgi:hypothetical protein